MASDKGKKKLLGEYLLERGLVTQEQVQKGTGGTAQSRGAFGAKP
jgi:hypothetical protein